MKTILFHSQLFTFNTSSITSTLNTQILSAFVAILIYDTAIMDTKAARRKETHLVIDF